MAVTFTEPDTTKAVTQAPGGEMTHFSMPISKWEDTGTVNPVDGTPDIEIWGKVTDGTLDSDLQVVDPEASLKWIKTWYDTKANIRMGHDARRPVGRGIDIDGHFVKGLIADPVAKHLVRTRVLNDWSVGIMNPEIRKGDPKFRHLDPMGKAVNGVITDRPDGLTQLGEISVVDRGSNYGTAFQIAKAAGDGSPEFTGQLTAPDDVLAKAAAPAVTKTKPTKTVNLDLPANMSLSVKPSDLAKLATFRQKLAVEQPEAVKAAVPAVAKAAEPAGAAKAAIPHEVLDGALDDALKALGAAEDAILGKGSRTFTAEQRREHASSGVALADGSYPMPDADAVGRAATLIRSKHGKWKAAARLLAKRVKALGIPNPLKKPKADKAIKGTTITDCSVTGASDGAVSVVVAEKKKGKMRALCPGCGAKQNPKHVHCPECGGALPAGAVQVTKNHDFVCLACGKELDKGEKHCPECGKENPGYLPEADKKIPANMDAGKAAKERVGTDNDVTKAKAKGGKKKDKKGKKEPFGGDQAPAFGKDKDEADEEKCKTAAPKAAKPKAEKRKGKGKGRSPAAGVKGHEGTVAPLPPHREPDGPPVEEFEHDAHLEDGDQGTEMAAAMRHKALGMSPDMGVLHDLTCPAYSPLDVSKAFPDASFLSIDTGGWQAKMLDAAAAANPAGAMESFNAAGAMWRASVALKGADPQILHDLRLEAHKAFRDANPGPGSFPTPTHPMPQSFNRPYLSAGHGAASPQHDAPNHFAVPHGQIQAEDYTRGYLTEGRATDSPDNATPRHEPAPAPMTGGQPEAVHYQGTMRDNARQAMTAMHDHVSRLFPDVCPMSPELTGTQKPAPPVAVGVGGPEPHAAKAAKKAKVKAKKAAKAKARKAARKRRALEARVFKGKVTVDDARAKLGMAPIGPETAVKAATPDAPPVAAGLDPEALTAAVKAATAPLVKRIGKQDKALRKQGKVLDAIAEQPDTSGAPFRGVATMKQASVAPAGPRTAAESAEQAQTAQLQRLSKMWKESWNPVEREAAYTELTRHLGISPTPDTTPMRT